METTETSAEGQRAGRYFAAASAWFGVAKAIDDAGPEVAAMAGMTTADAALSGAVAFASGIDDFIPRRPGAIFEAVAAKVRRNNEERRAAWRYRICAGIDAARRATPITAAEIRGRNGWRTSWRVVPR